MPGNNIDDAPNNAALVRVHAVRVVAPHPQEDMLVVINRRRQRTLDLIQELADQIASYWQECRQGIAALRQDVAELHQAVVESQEGMQQAITGVRQEIAGVGQEITGLRRAVTRYGTITIKGYNHTCGNGVNRNYEVMPFQDGSIPTQRNGRRRPLPAILTYDSIRELTVRQLGIYLRGYGVHPVPRGALARRTCLGRAIGLSGTLIHALEAQ